MDEKHPHHSFCRILKPATKRILMPKRKLRSTQKITAHGLFRGATVVRGKDWKYTYADGGPGGTGKIICIFGAGSEERRTSAVVVWSKNPAQKFGYYRIGFRGKVDLSICSNGMTGWLLSFAWPEMLCSNCGIWGKYYPGHLPVLDLQEYVQLSNIEDLDNPLPQAGPTIRELKNLPPGIRQTFQPEPGKFQQKGELGSGGFGTVVHCYDPKSGRDFALKKINLRRARSPAAVKQFIKSFEKEIQIFSKLPECPRVCRYLGSRILPNSVEIYLEYVAGGSLTSLLPIEENLARKFTKQVVEGLEFLHANDIIHRDVKCANILRDPSGCIKLTDFGVSTEVKNLAERDDAALTFTEAGTTHWMAPEVLTGEGYREKADIWSMGCTLVEMLRGHPPNHDVGPVRLGDRMKEKRLKWDLEPESASKECREFLMIMLDFTPSSRPSAAQVLELPYMRHTSA